MAGKKMKPSEASGHTSDGGIGLNKYVFHIVGSITCILLSVIGLFYGLWDSHQPKIGPIGDGKMNFPTTPQWIAIVSCFINGMVNLPVAVMRYRQNKKTNEDKKN